MNLALERILYISESVHPDPGLTVIAEILAASDRNNRRDGLTGALLISTGRFLQVLEGARQDLDRMLFKLEGDPRHRNMRVISRRAVEKRLFAHWTMAASRVSPAFQARMDEIIDLSGSSPTLAAESLLSLVERLGPAQE